jgi:nitrite reductase (NADH) large subunit
MRERLVLVGNGMAGMRAIEEILRRAPDRFAITVFGAEPEVNYNRILLSSLLAGETSFPEIVINDRLWYETRGIELIAGERIVAIDREARCVRGDKGSERHYDRLLLATGSDPIVIPIPGVGLPGVVTFRDVADVEAMLTAARCARRAVVIGGGLLGLEAANGLRAQGMDVTVLHLMPSLMERQLDAAAGALLAAALERRGIRILTEANTTAIHGRDRVASVELAEGTLIAADLVVMAVGIRPCVAVARAAGLAVKRGIVVDDALRTSDPSISAVGECVEHRGQTYGLVAPLFEMATICAADIAGAAEAPYEGSAIGTRLKVTGIELFSAGDFSGGPDFEKDNCEELVFRDLARGVYKRIVLADERIRGVVLYGEARDAAWYFQLMREATSISGFRELLIFGEAFAAAPRDLAA